jgi:hypothetical protein
MGWGHTPAAADAAIELLTAEHLTANNITIEVLHAWREFYLHESRRVAQNRNTLPRVRVLERAIELISN